MLESPAWTRTYSIRIRTLIVFAALFLSGPLTVWTAASEIEHDRPQGISIYLTPEKIVREAKASHVQRFVLAASDGTSAPVPSAGAEQLIENLKSELERLRAHGAWLVLSSPESYTEQDRKEFEKLKALMKEKSVPVYECRASELPGGWKRVR